MSLWYIILGLFILILSFHALMFIDEHKRRLFGPYSEMLVFYTILFLVVVYWIFGIMVILTYPEFYELEEYTLLFVLFTPLVLCAFLTAVSEMLRSRRASWTAG